MKIKSDGSTADYYEIPEHCRELQDIISYKNMNAQVAEIFRACMRYGEVDHSCKLRDAKKMQFYSGAEIDRLRRYEPEECGTQHGGRVDLEPGQSFEPLVNEDEVKVPQEPVVQVFEDFLSPLPVECDNMYTVQEYQNAIRHYHIHLGVLAVEPLGIKKRVNKKLCRFYKFHIKDGEDRFDLKDIERVWNEELAPYTVEED